MSSQRGVVLLMSVVLLAAQAATAKPRARDLGVPFEGHPGPLNAITDITGVAVGHFTLVRGSGKLVEGQGPVRTGVTAVLPRGIAAADQPVFAGWFSLNGNGEMTGTTWVEESGLMTGPVMITNTHSVGTVRDAVIGWGVERFRESDDFDALSLPVVAETWDGWLNDINGFHVRPEHAIQAIESARGGAVAEGNVGGGTGMICYHFKCGVGTASRRVKVPGGDYTLGVLVQANFGSRAQLTIGGVPVGRAITEYPAYVEPGTREAGERRGGGDRDTGSIIAVVATDAPFLPHQLKRLARRVGMGIARTGATASDSSGDIFIAFSTQPAGSGTGAGVGTVGLLPNDSMTPFFQATVEATEESIVNALVAGESMTGRDDHYVFALPHDRLRALLKRYGRLVPTP
ncbi:MAG: P1 family peptidase [Gammaproteobacteria bacterium]|nr:P1 family peptidase [Gammaproteobacteria bacterium]